MLCRGKCVTSHGLQNTYDSRLHGSILEDAWWLNLELIRILTCNRIMKLIGMANTYMAKYPVELDAIYKAK